MERESFVFYRSFYESIKCLSPEQAGECFKAICEYALNGEEIALEGVTKAIFTLIKPQIDANARRREQGIINGAKGAEYGKLGGRPKKENPQITPRKPLENPQHNPQKPSNVNVNVNDNVNVNVNGNVNENENVNVNEKEKSKEKTKVFFPPSFQDVNDYCTERHNGVDPQAFIDFYTSKGWMVGKTKMRDWKAAVRTWERRDADSIKSTRISQQDINRAKVEDFFRRNIGGL